MALNTLEMRILDRESPQPLFRQVESCIRTSLERGDLAPGTKLPSSRSLARRFGVSRNTIVAAFAELQAAGWVEAKRGSGTVVRGAPKPAAISLPPWNRVLRDAHFPLLSIPVPNPDHAPLHIYVTGRPAGANAAPPRPERSLPERTKD